MASATAEWNLSEFVAEKLETTDVETAKNVVELFEQDNTVSFIARYRKDRTKNMTPDDIRKAQCLWEEAKTVKKKIQQVCQQIQKVQPLTVQLSRLLHSSKCIDEIESLYAPFKPGAKSSLAQRAKDVGLEAPAMSILAGEFVDLRKFESPNTPGPRVQAVIEVTLYVIHSALESGLKSLTEVQEGVKHVLADFFHKQTETRKFVQDLLKQERIVIESSYSKAASKLAEEVRTKYQNYSDTKIPVAFIKPHQVLGMNRGEQEKVLSVKVVVPESASHRFCGFLTTQFLKRVAPAWRSLCSAALQDCFERLVCPYMCRSIRSDLSGVAERASIEVFAQNARQLLLAPPVRGFSVLGIDPGFKHGCKTAVISSSGDVLETGVFLLPTGQAPSGHASQFLRRLITKHACEKVAIGNGTGCREAEALVSDMIRKQLFAPVKVQYCIVNEAGASIYSVTKLAETELPNLDPNLRSAVSIARRLQDPLAELVKIEAEHMGIGMYQHDVKAKLLKESVNSVVEECVSFVGVDINTCSLELLQRVAGLNKNRASKILDLRKARGKITNREQLKSVKGVGEKTFQQCAGFVRVYPSTSLTNTHNADPKSSSRKRHIDNDEEVPTKKRRLIKNVEEGSSDVLDSTSVHPESYALVHRLLEHMGFTTDDVHSAKLRNALNRLTAGDTENLASKFQQGLLAVQQIIDSLKQPPHYDCREAKDAPLFRESVRRLEDLVVGSVLSGSVRNVTHFGVFVDVGVGRDGLIHQSLIRNGMKLEVGSRVEVRVRKVDIDRKRIDLQPVAFY